LIPAAGLARRLGALPFSKELFPVDVSDDPRRHVAKPVIEFLLENMCGSGIRRACVVIRDGKWDVPGHLGDGSRFGLALAYFIMGRPFGVPYSLDQAYDHIRDDVVALGFPDIVLCLPDAFDRCLNVQQRSRADVVLGGFPADHPPGVDMLDVAADGRVNGLIIKPATSSLSLTWGLATWGPAFTGFMHELLARRTEADAKARELQVADVFNEAIKAGLHVRAEIVSERAYVDIGTPDGLVRFMDDRKRHLSRSTAGPHEG
jgi:glucose-1-phosphate thymidylyltransferase